MSASIPAARAQPEAPAPPYLAVISITGPSWHSRLSQNGVVPLIHPEIHIGRLEANDIVLSDPGASRFHAAIEWSPQGYVLRDLGSGSGTFVDGRRLAGPTLLTPGQHVRVGATQLLFQALVIQDPAQLVIPVPAVTDGAAPFTTLPIKAIAGAVAQAQSSASRHWLRRQLPKAYWRIFLFGLAVFIVSWMLLEATGNTNLVPLVTLSAAAVVPVSFVCFCWEQGAFTDMPAGVVGLAFISGATLALLIAAAAGLVVGAAYLLFVGVIEETAKALAAVWFLRNPRLRSELDGLTVGAATGMGFAALETAGYGITTFLKNYVSPPPGSSEAAFAQAIVVAGGPLALILIARMVVAIFGHGIWTAIICAAIWRDRRGAMLRITGGVILAYALAIALHTIWDWFGVLGVLFDAIVGIRLLRFFMREAVARAKLAADTPAPALGPALLGYVFHPFRHQNRQVALPEAFVSAAVPASISPQLAGSRQAAGTLPADGPPAAPLAATAHCAACGAALGADTKFCESCGRPV